MYNIYARVLLVQVPNVVSSLISAASFLTISRASFEFPAAGNGALNEEMMKEHALQ